MTKEEALKGLPKGSVGIDFREKVEMVATDKHPFISPNEIYTCHPNLAKDAMAKGFARKK